MPLAFYRISYYMPQRNNRHLLLFLSFSILAFGPQEPHSSTRSWLLAPTLAQAETPVNSYKMKMALIAVAVTVATVTRPLTPPLRPSYPVALVCSLSLSLFLCPFCCCYLLCMSLLILPSVPFWAAQLSGCLAVRS